MFVHDPDGIDNIEENLGHVLFVSSQLVHMD